jgi:hypothetical protein
MQPSASSQIINVMSPNTPYIVRGKMNGDDNMLWWWLDDGTWVRNDVVRTNGDCNAVQVMTQSDLSMPNLNIDGALCVSVDRDQLPTQLQPDAQLLILDRSGSMSDMTDSGQTRIDVARDVLIEHVRSLPDNATIGLRAYGYGGCDGTRLPYPISTLNRQALIQTIINEAVADGSTPIAYSLEQIPSDFARISGSKEVLMVTDGQESCSEDPISVAQSLVSRYPELVIHVVGFDINDAQAQANLRGIPQVANGNYVEVNSSRGLLQALSIVVRLPFTVYDTNNNQLSSGLVNRSTIPLRNGNYNIQINELGISQSNIPITNGRGTRVQVDSIGQVSVIENDSLCIAEFCPDVPLPRLTVGQDGRVNRDDPGRATPRPVRVRTTPGMNGGIIGELAILEEFTVLDGPICNDGYLWWRIRNDRLEGWSAEGVFGNYFLEPLP